MTDERRFQAEFPEFLDLLENVASYIGTLDLAKVREVPAETLANLHEGLLRALDFLSELFALRGEAPPDPEPGVSFRSLGPSLRRTLPQRLAAQLADELNALPGSRPQDVSEFAALGLFARVVDLLRFVAYFQEERAEAIRLSAPPTILSIRHPDQPPPIDVRREPVPPPEPAAPPEPLVVPDAPPEPGGPGPDLSAYDLRLDEAGERIDAGTTAVWYAAAGGPNASGPSRAAAFAVPFPGGIAFAVAEGAEASLGARLASVVAVRAFSRAAALNPSAPEAAVKTAQHHLDMLLSALLSAGDTAESLSRMRGDLPVANARRILKHTKQPEDALRRVTPALATTLVGAVAVPLGSALSVSVVRLGPGLAEARLSGRVTPLLGASRRGTVPLLGPGVRGAEDVSRMDPAVAVSLSPGDALLLGNPALAKGAASGWAALAALWPSFPDGLASGETARDLLRRAERWGEAEPPHFGGPLALALLVAR